MEKICTICNKQKNLDEFVKNKGCKDGRAGWCKECSHAYRKKRGFNLYSYRREKVIEYQRNLRKTEKYKLHDKEYRAKYGDTFAGMITNMLSSVRYRAKKDKLDIDIDRKWIIERVTPMKCEVTGIDLVLGTDRSVSHTPFKPSVDRINNNKGYTKDNCRIVAVIYNKAKSDYADEDVLRMATALVENRKV